MTTKGTKTLNQLFTENVQGQIVAREFQPVNPMELELKERQAYKDKLVKRAHGIHNAYRGGAK